MTNNELVKIAEHIKGIREEAEKEVLEAIDSKNPGAEYYQMGMVKGLLQIEEYIANEMGITQ